MLPAQVQARIASEFHVAPEVIAQIQARLEAGDPLAYVSRRYPELVGALAPAAIRRLKARIDEAKELEARRANVLRALEAAGPDGSALIPLAQSAHERSQLDDLQAKLRTHRGTRGTEAAAKGLEPLADLLLHGKHDGKTPDECAAPFVTVPAAPVEGAPVEAVSAEKTVASPHEALSGAEAILSERFAADPEVRARVRREIRDRGEIVSKLFDSSKPGAERYKEFFNFRGRGKSLAGKRLLKIRRGEREKVLKVVVEIPVEEVVADLERKMLGGPLGEGASEADQGVRKLLLAGLRDAVGRHLLGALEVEVRSEWKERADLETIGFLRRNLRTVCMRPAYGARTVLGVDPGVRKGLRVAVAAPNGAFVAEATFATEGADRATAVETARALLRDHRIEAIALAAGESGALAAAFFREVMGGKPAAAPAAPIVAAAPSAPAEDATPAIVLTETAVATAEAPVEAAAPLPRVEIFLVPDTGAAFVANSAAAREELGDKPVPVRAALSMARRLQDPLAELARVDPKILAGSHHGQDVARGRLERLLAEELESCVHEIPIDLQRATAPLLALVGDMGAESAKKVVEWRTANGPFPTRVALALVGLDETAYLRAVAFVRVAGSAEPLDETGVHPDHAAVAAKIVAALGVPSCREATPAMLDALALDPLVDDATPLAVLRHVRDLLALSGVDPRGQLHVTPINAGVRGLGDLKFGVELEGVVRGLAAFGVFVDVGLSHEGLVHVSELTDHFVKDPSEVVQVGDRVRVRVLEVDPKKRKIALTMRSEESRQAAEDERIARREARLAARERAKERRHFQAAAEAARAAAAANPEAAAAAAAGTDASAGAGAHPNGGRPDRGRGRDRDRRPVRPQPPAQRAAVSRRDGLSGGQRGRGGFGGGNDRRGGRDGRSRDRDMENDADAARGPEVKKEKKDTPPPANPFKKFFQSKGLLEG